MYLSLKRLRFLVVATMAVCFANITELAAE